MDFPTIQQPTFPLKIEYENTSIMSEFEDGSVQSRNKFTRSRRTFTISWDFLSQNDYTTLFGFIKNTCKFSALPFNWVNPQSNETIEVRATGGFDTWQLRETNYWSGELTLQEV